MSALPTLSSSRRLLVMLVVFSTAAGCGYGRTARLGKASAVSVSVHHDGRVDTVLSPGTRDAQVRRFGDKVVKFQYRPQRGLIGDVGECVNEACTKLLWSRAPATLLEDGGVVELPRKFESQPTGWLYFSKRLHLDTEFVGRESTTGLAGNTLVTTTTTTFKENYLQLELATPWTNAELITGPPMKKVVGWSAFPAYLTLGYLGVRELQNNPDSPNKLLVGSSLVGAGVLMVVWWKLAMSD